MRGSFTLSRSRGGRRNDRRGLRCTQPGSTCRTIADEIEDIQFAYACDGCVTGINSGVPDDIIDNQGGASGFDQADFLTNTTWTTAPLTADKIRFVQVTVVGRQRSSDQGFGESNRMSVQSSALQVSDHLHSDGVFVAGDYAALNPRIPRRGVVCSREPLNFEI